MRGVRRETARRRGEEGTGDEVRRRVNKRLRTFRVRVEEQVARRRRRRMRERREGVRGGGGGGGSRGVVVFDFHERGARGRAATAFAAVQLLG